MERKRVSSAQKAAQFEKQFFSNVNFQTELGDLLLSLYSWGKIPATIVQRVAYAAMNDCKRAFGECQLQEWQILAKLGDYGFRSNNISRDLSLKFPANVFPLTQITIPIQVAKSKGMIQTTMCQVPFLLPEDSWQVISKNEGYFNIPDTACIQSWWESCGQHPALLNHPVKKIQNFATRAVPCVLHGDGAAVTQNIGSSSKSCLFISYKMLCADQTDHMLICSLWNQLTSDSKGFKSIYSIWLVVARNFERIMASASAIDNSEKFPVVVFSTGDLGYFNVYHNLPRWNSVQPCGLCEINKGNLKRCRVVSPLPPDGWSTARSSSCPLFRSMMSPLSVAVDWMHSKHLGLDQRFLGSVLWLFIYHIYKTRGSVEQRLALLLHNLKEYWRKNAIPGGLNSLTLGVLALVCITCKFFLIFPGFF